MEKSLFYLCRRWLHSKAAPERIILVLKNREMISFFICPHISLSSSALGLSWLALQEEKLIFEHYCYCPIFHSEGDQNAHPWLGIWTFPYGKLKRSHVVLCLSGRMHHRGSLKVSGAKSWSSTQLEILHRDRNNRAGGDSTRDEISTRRAREGARVWRSHSAVGGKPEGAQGYRESCKNRISHAFL